MKKSKWMKTTKKNTRKKLIKTRSSSHILTVITFQTESIEPQLGMNEKLVLQAFVMNDDISFEPNRCWECRVLKNSSLVGKINFVQSCHELNVDNPKSAKMHSLTSG